jgi:hypothetical protein
MAHRAARYLAHKTATAGIIVLAKTYDLLTKTRPRTVRRLAGSREAQAARERAEQHLRDIVRAYDALPTLTLGLLTIEDTCSGGGGWTLASDNNSRLSCTLYATAYYTASQDAGTVLDDVLTAGEAPHSLIAFSHSAQPYISSETQWLFGTGQTLSWDTPAGRLVGEARPCRRESDPPIYRCLREGDHNTVDALRSTAGSVFRLELSPVVYYRISR